MNLKWKYILVLNPLLNSGKAVLELHRKSVALVSQPLWIMQGCFRTDDCARPARDMVPFHMPHV